MCYSGKCTWEQHSGDCGFPTIKAVRDKYPLPLCEIGEDNQEDAERLQMMIADVKKIIKTTTMEVDIREWAKQIHRIKIRELKEVIAKLQKEYDSIKDVTYINPSTDLYMHLRMTTILTDLLKLNLKLDILTKKQ